MQNSLFGEGSGKPNTLRQIVMILDKPIGSTNKLYCDGRMEVSIQAVWLKSVSVS